MKEQISTLNSGVDIVVGTPGRLEDLIQGGHLFLTHCRYILCDALRIIRITMAIVSILAGSLSWTRLMVY